MTFFLYRRLSGWFTHHSVLLLLFSWNHGEWVKCWIIGEELILPLSESKKTKSKKWRTEEPGNHKQNSYKYVSWLDDGKGISYNLRVILYFLMVWWQLKQQWWWGEYGELEHCITGHCLVAFRYCFKVTRISHVSFFWATGKVILKTKILQRMTLRM